MAKKILEKIKYLLGFEVINIWTGHTESNLLNQLWPNILDNYTSVSLENMFWYFIYFQTLLLK